MGNPSCLSCLRLSRFALPPHEDTAVTWDACLSPVVPRQGGLDAMCEGHRRLGWRCQISSVRHGYNGDPSAAHREQCSMVAMARMDVYKSDTMFNGS